MQHAFIEFFGPERVLFRTDAPFDTRGGAHFILDTISNVVAAVVDGAARHAVFEGNARRVLGIA